MKVRQSAAGVSDETAPDFVERAYLDYAMAVILDRALPVLDDGLKPVQRRIIYAMSELGLSDQAKPKKSARTVGDVIGKFHPHGDGACYEAMVLMSQDFSYRYPLVDGHGNWGSVDDPKSFAAMRYTEARLTPYAKTLTEELGQGTVDWRPNFDNTLKEPTRLPARLPNVLLNGASGIAVGMSTDIPPHNLTEVVNACIAMLSKASITDAELYKHIPGPDFPGGGVICSDKRTIREAYDSGVGNIRVRANYKVDDDNIIITAIPYQVSTVRVIEQIAAQVRKKKLPLIRDLRDESTEADPVRIVITLKGKKVSADQLMAHLFATTDLERVCRINLNIIGPDGTPATTPLRQVLQQWLDSRLATVRRRLEWRLGCVNDRLEELEGFLIAYAHIDEIIKIIRRSDDPQPELMKAFNLSERQAHAILELKLRRLAKLEYVKVEEERKTLRAEKKEIDRVLEAKNSGPLKTLVKKELQDALDIHGDKRRTKISGSAPEASALNIEELGAAAPLSVVVSFGGWVRTVKGHVDEAKAKSYQYQGGDKFLALATTSSQSSVAFFDETGRCFCSSTAGLPSGKGYGEPLSNRFTLGGHIISASDAPTKSDGLILAVSKKGYMLAAPIASLPAAGHSKGKRLMKVGPKDKMVDAVCVPEGKTVLVNGRLFKYADLAKYTFASKGGVRGKMLPTGCQQSRKQKRIVVKD